MSVWRTECDTGAASLCRGGSLAGAAGLCQTSLAGAAGLRRIVLFLLIFGGIGAAVRSAEPGDRPSPSLPVALQTGPGSSSDKKGPTGNPPAKTLENIKLP